MYIFGFQEENLSAEAIPPFQGWLGVMSTAEGATHISDAPGQTGRAEKNWLQYVCMVLQVSEWPRHCTD